ncbi:GUN4 domain-containing protein [Scytonema sp. PCC 10023]|uniref:GUN4 domain-containing protein n=1 Tax=Scytonema sp. PCC 10023 TaxID=1680591 RepID=UPI0039C6BB06
MSTWITDWVLPLLQTVISNVALAYLVNQLQPSANNNQTFLLMAVCIVAIIIINFWQSKSQQSQQNSAPANQNGIVGFLPLLGGVTLYSISNYLPTDIRQTVSYISLFLFTVGTVLPAGILLPRKWRRRLIWIIPGAGLFITLYFLIKSQWIAGLLWSLLTAILVILAFLSSFIYGVINRVLEKIKQWLKQMEPLVADIIISKFGESTSQFQAKYYKNLVYTYRTYRTQGLKTPGAFTPDLEKVFVPLRMALKSPVQMSSALIQKETTGDLKIWDFLAEIRTTHTYRRMVIIAPPGYGKTTLLEHLTLAYAQNTQQQQHPQAPKLIPVLLYLRKIRNQITSPQSPNLAQLVIEVVKTESQESSTKLDPSQQWFEDRLKSGKCLVMLDGLDEVADINQRQRVSQWVDAQMRAYPETTFLLTSRPYGYQEAQLQQQPFCLEVQPFNLKQMEEFINNWYLQNEVMRQARKEDAGVRADAKRKAFDLIERIKNNPALAAMALNPLLLTMIATVHDNRGALPGARVELYAEICEVLLARRQQVKGIDYPIPLNAAQKQSVLQVLALQLMQNKTREFTPDIGEQIIQQQLSAVSGNKVETNAFFKHIEQVSGLLLEKQQGVYEFAHKSFQEYLAAVEVQETNNEQILRDNINDSWWDETIRLYAAKNDTSNLIEAALRNPTIVSLSIAYDCLQEGRSVTPQVRQQLEEVLEANLESSNPQFFQIAAEVKLIRQLSQLVRIDEKLEIDNSYITCAQYQLFLDYTGEALQPQHWQNNRFPVGHAKKPITGVSWENANRFCVWLKSWSEKQGLSTPIGELATHYRLLTEEERNQHSINDDKLFADSGIRLLRFKIPSRYNQLAHDLLSGEWQKADEETYQVMLKVAGRKSQGYLDEEDIENFPCDDLRIIDNLWVYASKGHFGFSVQKKIYQELGGTKRYNEKIWNTFGDRVGWRKGGSWVDLGSITFSISAGKGHLPLTFFVFVRRDISREGGGGVNIATRHLFSRAETCRL